MSTGVESELIKCINSTYRLISSTPTPLQLP
jgi:hypothetical protein